MNSYPGIIHRSPDQRLVHLPLQEVYVRVWMVDVSARVVLSQVFENESESPTSRAKYVFPLPASAAACAFELEHADGRVIVGIAKEKLEAAEAFQSALDAGRTAGLVEFVTDDMFTISVGSIPAKQRVTARLTFVMDLLDEGRQDYIRLQLPMAITGRYGEMPQSMVDASTVDQKTRVQIAVDIQTSDTIQDVSSPTHPISLMYYKTRTGRKSERRISATWSSTTFLDQDFVLTVYALGLDNPRCFAEVNPKRADTIAMQLSFVSKFKIPRITAQEYIFVIDRSTSMTGNPIETAKRTLEMLLHLLPDSQTTFNIFSFGEHVDGMWRSSVSFTEVAMKRAISNVQIMQANYGYTEIAKALQFAIGSRNRDRPTAMFVLTDGRVHPSASLDPYTVVSSAVKNCKPNAPLRLFTLGIGEYVSSAMCERLAREGGGECLFAVQVEDITGKCARLLNAGRTCVIDSVTVDWYSSGNLPTVNFSSSNHHYPLPSSIVQLEPPPPIQQVPHEITKIFPGMRFNIFAITTFRSIPSEVRLRAKVKDLAEVLELVVPVTVVKPFKDEWSSIPLLHTLAARELIKHLAEGRTSAAPLPKPIVPASDGEVRKAAIVRLGLEFQLVSQYTSFFAEESGKETTRIQRRSSPWQRFRKRHNYVPASQVDATGDTQDTTPETDPSTLKTVLGSLSQLAHAVLGPFSSGPSLPTPTRQGRFPGTYTSTAPSCSDSPIQSDHSFKPVDSLEGPSANSRLTYSRSHGPVRPLEGPIEHIPSPVLPIERISSPAPLGRFPGTYASTAPSCSDSPIQSDHSFKPVDSFEGYSTNSRLTYSRPHGPVRPPEGPIEHIPSPVLPTEPISPPAPLGRFPGTYTSTAPSCSDSPIQSDHSFKPVDSFEGYSTNSRWTYSRPPGPVRPLEGPIEHIPSPVLPIERISSPAPLMERASSPVLPIECISSPAPLIECECASSPVLPIERILSPAPVIECEWASSPVLPIESISSPAPLIECEWAPSPVLPIERIPSPVLLIHNSPIQQLHAPTPALKEAYSLISLQSYDGSFSPSPRLGALLGAEILAKAGELQVDKNIWATAVAVAYLQYHLCGQPDLLEALLSKALEYVERGGAGLLIGRKFSDLVRSAGRSLGLD